MTTEPAAARSDESTSDTSVSATRDVVPFRQALRTWFMISLQTFGGPAGQIAVMQHSLVDNKRWIGQKRFLHALNYCMLLPGPEAQQLVLRTLGVCALLGCTAALAHLPLT
jgi:chromate transporter